MGKDGQIGCEHIYDCLTENGRNYEEKLNIPAVMPSLPKYDTIKDKAFEYAKDQWKNDNCTYQDLKYAEKDFMNGAIWMMKLLKGNEA